MNYGYIRVSTDKQDVEGQRICILTNKKDIEHFFEEVISTRKDLKKRKIIEYLDTLKKGDILTVTEISRLGRSMYEIYEIVSYAQKKGVIIEAIKQGWVLGDDLQSKILLNVFCISAEIERSLISDRTKMGVEKARRSGKQIGRVKGYKPAGKLDEHKKEIISLKKSGISYTLIAKKFDVDYRTVKNICTFV